MLGSGSLNTTIDHKNAQHSTSPGNLLNSLEFHPNKYRRNSLNRPRPTIHLKKSQKSLINQQGRDRAWRGCDSNLRCESPVAQSGCACVPQLSFSSSVASSDC